VRKGNCLAQFLGKVDLRQLVAAQVHELLPERLQRVHLLLALGLAGTAIVVFGLGVGPVVGIVDHRCL
jgi:hypothetical protein